MDEKILRDSLVYLLEGKGAHVDLVTAVTDVDPSKRFVRPSENLKSIWEELEHIRIAQEDILRYALDENWRSPKWPQGYWPAEHADPKESQWDETIRLILRDLAEAIALVKNEDIDLSAQIPHGEEGHTYLRELLLIADHNAYHVGQIVTLRKLLGDWS